MLTEDMTRLCGEINAMRRMRGRMMTGLQHDAKELKQSVSELCAHFGRARTTMAKRTKNERAAFLNNLKRYKDPSHHAFCPLQQRTAAVAEVFIACQGKVEMSYSQQSRKGVRGELG